MRPTFIAIPEVRLFPLWVIWMTNTSGDILKSQLVINNRRLDNIETTYANI